MVRHHPPARPSQAENDPWKFISFSDLLGFEVRDFLNGDSGAVDGERPVRLLTFLFVFIRSTRSRLLTGVDQETSSSYRTRFIRLFTRRWGSGLSSVSRPATAPPSSTAVGRTQDWVESQTDMYRGKRPSSVGHCRYATPALTRSSSLQSEGLPTASYMYELTAADRPTHHRPHHNRSGSAPVATWTSLRHSVCTYRHAGPVTVSRHGSESSSVHSRPPELLQIARCEPVVDISPLWDWPGQLCVDAAPGPRIDRIDADSSASRHKSF
jgi:hypothetical protein